MISAFVNILKVPELKQRILFTLAIIIIVRLGAHIILPGINIDLVNEWVARSSQEQQSGGAAALGAMLTIFSGGALQSLGLFSLGIMPYISASIMVQLLTAVLPAWQKKAREEGGRQEITKWTRILTLVIAAVQGFLLVKGLANPGSSGGLLPNFKESPILDPSWVFTLQTVIILMASTMFLMWLGDQITEKGLGNGVSLIITVNILHSLPGAIAMAWRTLVYPNSQLEPMGALKVLFLVIFMVAVIAAMVILTQAQRRITIQYAKRVQGNKVFQGATQYLPLKLNYAGVMPVIFASALFGLPVMLVNQIWPGQDIANTVQMIFSPASGWYYAISGFAIFFFSYFWVATMFQPSQIAEDLKRNGGYVPGIRPGKPTAEFLDHTMSRLTFCGALFLVVIYFLPYMVQAGLNLNQVIAQFFGGTSLLIIVGVLLDTMRQVETTLLQRNYDGFLRKSKTTGRRPQEVSNAASARSVVLLWVAIAIIVLVGLVLMALK